jgi:hypothetical protein
VTRSGRSPHSVNVAPTSLHPVNSASKKLHRLKAQPVNAVSVCRDALKRTLPNTQSVNTEFRVTASEKSTSWNSHRT